MIQLPVGVSPDGGESCPNRQRLTCRLLLMVRVVPTVRDLLAIFCWWWVLSQPTETYLQSSADGECCPNRQRLIGSILLMMSVVPTDRDLLAVFCWWWVLSQPSETYLQSSAVGECCPNRQRLTCSLRLMVSVVPTVRTYLQAPAGERVIPTDGDLLEGYCRGW